MPGPVALITVVILVTIISLNFIYAALNTYYIQRYNLIPYFFAISTGISEELSVTKPVLINATPR